MINPTLTPESSRELVRKWRERAESCRDRINSLPQEGTEKARLLAMAEDETLRCARELEALLEEPR